MITANDVLSYWFGDVAHADYPQAKPAVWWGHAPDTDAFIRERFLATYEAATRGELADWDATPRGLLAHVIVLDQFTRNMFRDTPAMYASDADAQDLVLQALSDGVDRRLLPTERPFLYMPLMHAENRALQRLCVRLFAQERDDATPARRAGAEGTLGFAIKHADIVEKFGRFPHRNSIFGRVSTPEEEAFFAENGQGF